MNNCVTLPVLPVGLCNRYLTLEDARWQSNRPTSLGLTDAIYLEILKKRKNQITAKPMERSIVKHVITRIVNRAIFNPKKKNRRKIRFEWKLSEIHER